MNSISNENICYNMQDLQQLLPIGKNKLYELVHSKGFPRIKVGKRILIPKKSFDEWLVKASTEQLTIG